LSKLKLPKQARPAEERAHHVIEHQTDTWLCTVDIQEPSTQSLQQNQAQVNKDIHKQ